MKSRPPGPACLRPSPRQKRERLGDVVTKPPQAVGKDFGECETTQNNAMLATDAPPTPVQ